MIGIFGCSVGACPGKRNPSPASSNPVEKLRFGMQNDREKEAEKGPGRGRRERGKVGIEVLAIREGGGRLWRSGCGEERG